MDIAVYRLPSTATTVTDVTRNPIARNRLNNGNAAYCFFFFFFLLGRDAFIALSFQLRKPEIRFYLPYVRNLC